mgnify:CR=1 FL=1
MVSIPRLSVLLMTALLFTACSTRIVPQPTATAVLNVADNSLTEVHDGIVISARVDELSVQPYQLSENLAAFHIVVDNRSDRPFTPIVDAFVLRDGESRQYRVITPEHVMEIVSKDTVYLIPYPYVGYYYLEDQEHGASTQAMASSLPYYAEYHPQDIFTQALPAGPVLPHSKVSGKIYFLADPSRTDHVELLLFADPALQGEPRYRFPFTVEK